MCAALLLLTFYSHLLCPFKEDIYEQHVSENISSTEETMLLSFCWQKVTFSAAAGDFYLKLRGGDAICG